MKYNLFFYHEHNVMHVYLLYDIYTYTMYKETIFLVYYCSQVHCKICVEYKINLNET